MRIALIGYGKMGKEIEAIAVERGHKIVFKSNERDEVFSEELLKAEVAIEFTTPDAAVDNIIRCLDVKLPVVVGTTGWMDQLDQVKLNCVESKGSLLYASNFSIGVNILFNVNEHLATLMNGQSMYEVDMQEIHHTEKLDAPSGTAITLAEGITNNLVRKKGWTLEDPQSDQIKIEAIREENVPGTHSLRYSSEIDEIQLTHTAKGRKGFALGAVLAAEWLPGKTGVFTMKDLLKL